MGVKKLMNFCFSEDKLCLIFILFSFFSIETCFTGCLINNSQNFEELSFCCWNVQTFFDAEADGCEYSEFLKNQSWNKDSYIVRVKRLADAVKTLNCDVFVFEEIENQDVIIDIANQLAGSEWKKSCSWNYTCFAKEKGSAIGCAVFSKFPLSDMKTHTIDVRTEESSQPSSRPVIQVTVNAGEKKLIVFVNHWKSKSNGEEESEVWREWQESLLTDRIKAVQQESGSNTAIIACGDFNKDIGEFAKVIDSVDFLDVSKILGNSLQDEEMETYDYTNTGNIVLRNLFQNVFEGGEYIIVHSPWINSDGSLICEKGSYYYKNSWERIDQIFSCGNLYISEFESVSDGEWADENGVPVSYKIYTGQGFSDHLPLRCKIRLN